MFVRRAGASRTRALPAALERAWPLDRALQAAPPPVRSVTRSVRGTDQLRPRPNTDCRRTSGLKRHAGPCEAHGPSVGR